MHATSCTDLSPVLQPLEDARGLPNAHYTSQAVFDEERRAVMFSNWAGVGFSCDVPNPGDVKPMNFMGMPLLLVHDHEGTVSVFQNTCRHRGMILVEQPTNIRKVVRCPYHSWCYGLDGKLQATPHVGGAGQNTHASIKPEQLGLFGVPSAVYLGVVFVNISGNAAPFDEYAAALKKRWFEFDQPVCSDGNVSRCTLSVKANWKLAVENYCESYHLPWIHPTLNSYSRLEDHYNIESPGEYSGQGTYKYRQLKAEDGLVFPDFENLGEQWQSGAEYIALYPNVLLGVHRDHTFALILEPISVELTTEHIALFYSEQGAADERLNALRCKNTEQWEGVFREDIQVVEGMQAGRHGELFDGGRFSPVMDGPTHNFHHWVAKCVQHYRDGLKADAALSDG